MLTLIENPARKTAAHKQLVASLSDSWRKRETRVVAWRPDSREITIHHNGRYWFGSVAPSEHDPVPRYWDPYGEYREGGQLEIAVELNVPSHSNSRRVAAFFAEDTGTGERYLMHDGGVGGGRKEIGRANFLWWSDARLVAVVDSGGTVRPGIIVARIGSRTADDVSRFVQSAVDFKLAVKNGEFSGAAAHKAARTYGDYYDEFSGKKQRRRIGELEYVSRHGDIVRALRNWRQRRASPNERIVKDAYIDVGIERGGTLTELYEVKPSCDRQSLYTAIGQLLVHDRSRDGACRRFIVLPAEEDIPDDIGAALRSVCISVLRFRFRNDQVRILGHTVS